MQGRHFEIILAGTLKSGIRRRLDLGSFLEPCVNEWCNFQIFRTRILEISSIVKVMRMNNNIDERMTYRIQLCFCIA